MTTHVEQNLAVDPDLAGEVHVPGLEVHGLGEVHVFEEVHGPVEVVHEFEVVVHGSGVAGREFGEVGHGLVGVGHGSEAADRDPVEEDHALADACGP